VELTTGVICGQTDLLQANRAHNAELASRGDIFYAVSYFYYGMIAKNIIL